MSIDQCIRDTTPCTGCLVCGREPDETPLALAARDAEEIDEAPQKRKERWASMKLEQGVYELEFTFSGITSTFDLRSADGAIVFQGGVMRARFNRGDGVVRIKRRG